MKRGWLLGLGLSLFGCNSVTIQEDNRQSLKAPMDLTEKAERFFAACENGKYDFDTRCVDFETGILGKIKDSVYRLDIRVKVELAPGIELEAQGGCSATLLQGGYVLTAGHCTDENMLLEEFSELPHTIDFSLASKEGRHGLEVIMQGQNSDFAILRLKEQADLPYLPIALGNADQLVEGNEIYLYGFIDDEKVNLRQGIIATVEPKDEFDGKVMDGYFLIAWLQKGDSGGPVIAFRDGVPELVGIASYIHTEHLYSGAILKINKIMEEARCIIYSEP